MTTNTAIESYHHTVNKFFNETAEAKAREHKFVERRSPINGRNFLLSLILTAYQYGLITLDQLASTAQEVDPDCQVEGQAFKERFNQKAVAFLQACLVIALQMTLPGSTQLLPLLSIFSAVYVLDSSVIPLPDSLKEDFAGCGGAGAGAAAKLYMLLNWLTGSYEALILQAGRKADQNMGKEFVEGRLPGALWLFDLGFFNVGFLSSIVAAASYFLCRLYGQVSIWVRNAKGEWEKLDLDELLKYSEREIFEIEVAIGANQEVKARLILAPVPKQVAEERRRKARENARRQGRTVSNKMLMRCDWTLMITNAKGEQLPTSTIIEIYRVRWQVELAFKLMKSEGKLDETLAREKNRVKCEFYGKLIMLVIFNGVQSLIERSEGKKVSAVKAWRRMVGDVKRWMSLMCQTGVEGLKELIEFLKKRAARKRTVGSVKRLEEAASEARESILEDVVGYLSEKKKTAAERKALFNKLRKVRNVVLSPLQVRPQVSSASTVTD